MTVSSPEGIRLDSLREYLAEPLGLDPAEPVEATLVEGGRSNLTYFLGQGGRSWVLRRPPCPRK